jgi:hypothetical protein
MNCSCSSSRRRIMTGEMSWYWMSFVSICGWLMKLFGFKPARSPFENETHDFDRKMMVQNVWSPQGFRFVDALQKSRKSHLYHCVDIILWHVLESRSSAPGPGLTIDAHNARPRAAQKPLKNYRENPLEMSPNHLSSPKLAPYDLVLFARVTNPLEGSEFPFEEIPRPLFLPYHRIWQAALWLRFLRIASHGWNRFAWIKIIPIDTLYNDIFTFVLFSSQPVMLRSRETPYKIALTVPNTLPSSQTRTISMIKVEMCFEQSLKTPLLRPQRRSVAWITTYRRGTSRPFTMAVRRSKSSVQNSMEVWGTNEEENHE